MAVFFDGRYRNHDAASLDPDPDCLWASTHHFHRSKGVRAPGLDPTGLSSLKFVCMNDSFSVWC